MSASQFNLRNSNTLNLGRYTNSNKTGLTLGALHLRWSSVVTLGFAHRASVQPQLLLSAHAHSHLPGQMA